MEGSCESRIIFITIVSTKQYVRVEYMEEYIGKNRNFEPSFPSYVIYGLTAMQLRSSSKIHFNLDNSPRHSEEAFSGNLPCLPIHVIYSFIPYFRTEIRKNRRVRAARIEKWNKKLRERERERSAVRVKVQSVWNPCSFTRIEYRCSAIEEEVGDLISTEWIFERWSRRKVECTCYARTILVQRLSGKCRG